MIFTCRIDATQTAQAGLFCRFDGQQGIGVTIDRAQGTLQVAEFRRQGEQYVVKPLDTRYKAPLADQADELRILTRDHRIEVYLNAQWMFGITMADTFQGSGGGRDHRRRPGPLPPTSASPRSSPSSQPIPRGKRGRSRSPSGTSQKAPHHDSFLHLLTGNNHTGRHQTGPTGKHPNRSTLCRGLGQMTSIKPFLKIGCVSGVNYEKPRLARHAAGDYS